MECTGLPGSIPLKTMDVPRVGRVARATQELQVPRLCLETSSSMAGSGLVIGYISVGKLPEFYSLNEQIAAFIGSQKVRDLELFTQVVARFRGSSGR